MSRAAPDGPTAEHVLSVIRSMSVAERKRLGELLDDDESPLLEAGYIVEPKGVSDVALNLTKVALNATAKNSVLLIQIEKQMKPVAAKLQQLSPLDRSGKAPKEIRNELIHRYLTEQQFRRDQVFQFMLTQHHNLMTVGKGRQKKTIAESSMWDGYNRWLRDKRAY